eukprot:TRINITY_DN21167_c0_g1_i1.p1 TRINITY_DN21167_c0_g1~~TRINITY_DN21167_c0_g1_i1.p1  ORF type:complete len:310 (+),score=29.12 TRINITY_DN21167_c0_g1_i1:28-930(+)
MHPICSSDHYLVLILRHLDDRWMPIVRLTSKLFDHLFNSFFRSCLRKCLVDFVVGEGQGPTSCLDYLYKNGACLLWDEITCAQAAAYGNVDCLRYAHERRCPWNEQTALIAIQYNHVACLQYALENGLEVNVRRMIMECLRHGHRSILHFLYQTYNYNADNNDDDFNDDFDDEDEDLMTNASYYGHVDCVAYLHDVMGIKWDVQTTQNATKRQGNLPCLQYLHEHGCEWNSKTILTAAYSDNLECLMYAHQNGCRVPEQFLHVGKRCMAYIDTAIYPGYSQNMVLYAGSYYYEEEEDDWS